MKSYAKELIAAAVLAATCGLGGHAQYYDDDDLYYSPAHAAEREAAANAARAAAAARKAKADSLAAQAAGLGASDTYTTGSSRPLAMDVDTYNRRNAAPAVTEPSDEGSFTYTRRIERFHNPDVVEQSGDSTLMAYYYNTPSEKDINVYVINNLDPVWGAPGLPFYSGRYGGWFNFDPWDFGWYTPLYSFGWGYRPWYGWAWGPSWSWGWSWGWTPGWGWGPGWPGPALPGPVYGDHWAHNPPGAMRPHRPATGAGMTRPSTSSDRYHPGQTGRPGSFGRSGTSVPSAPAGSYRPGYTPGSTPGSYNPSNNDRRGRNNSGTYNPSAPSRNNNGSTYRNTTPYRSSGNSGGSYRGGGSGSRSTGGGGSYGGGGGSRGRGR